MPHALMGMYAVIRCRNHGFWPFSPAQNIVFIMKIQNVSYYQLSAPLKKSAIVMKHRHIPPIHLVKDWKGMRDFILRILMFQFTHMCIQIEMPINT
jgi:hypothetical protein